VTPRFFPVHDRSTEPEGADAGEIDVAPHDPDDLTQASLRPELQRERDPGVPLRVIERGENLPDLLLGVPGG
jgi:hypothetical protein